MSEDKGLLRVHFCCNDRHGYPNGLVSKIEIRTEDGDELELETLAWNQCVVFRREMHCGELFVRVGSRRFSIIDYHYHAGNLFWDAATMSHNVARECVRHALHLGFAVTCHTHDNPLLEARDE